MSDIRDNFKITTNHQPRPLLFWSELTKKEQADFDLADDTDSMEFFRYRGEVYAVNEFLSAGNAWSCLPENHPFRQWDGHLTDSYFSAVVIKYPREFGYVDSENIIVGTVTC